MSVTTWRPVVSTIICIAAVGLAGFLTWAHYFDQQAISHSCQVFEGHGSNSFVSCNVVTSSAQSVILGLPVALYGLVYFAVMLGFCLPAAWRSASLRIAQLRVVLTVAGMAFVVYLVGVELLSLHHLCALCTGVHLLQFGLFLLVLTGWYDAGRAVVGSRQGDGHLPAAGDEVSTAAGRGFGGAGERTGAAGR